MFIFSKSLDSWYDNLVKARYFPPKWMFSLRIILFIFMSLAFYNVWTSEIFSSDEYHLFAYILMGMLLMQLPLCLFSYLFSFMYKRIRLSFVVLFFQFLLLIFSIAFAFMISFSTMLFIIPYFLWEAYITVCTFILMLINKC